MGWEIIHQIRQNLGISGICDGILSSLHEIKYNPDINLALAEFWTPKTNTFIFPLVETTISLQEIKFLFGMPVSGESMDLSLTDNSSKNLVHILQQVENALS